MPKLPLHILEKISPKTLIAFSIALYLLHFFFIIWLAVDVPIHDEWNMFMSSAPEFFQPDVFWSFIFKPHGQHYIVPTRIISWFAYHLTNFDYSLIIIFDFILYGLEILLLVWILRKYLKTIPTWFLTFLPFFLNGRTYENHLMSAQNQIHVLVIFSLLSAYLLFNPTRNFRLQIIGAVMTLVPIFSFASGAAETLGLAAVYTLSIFVERSREKNSVLTLATLKSLLPSAIMGINVLVWAYLFFKHAPDIQDTASPFSFPVWDFFLNLISSLFGYHWLSWEFGFLLLTLMTVPLVLLFFRYWKSVTGGMNAVRMTGEEKCFFWLCVSISVSVCAAFVMISLGRSSGAPTGISKSSRYAEVGQMIIPFSIFAWYLLLKAKPWLFKRVVQLFVVVWFIGSFGSVGYLGPMGDKGFLKSLEGKSITEASIGIMRSSFWDFNRIYQDYRFQRVHGLECLRFYYSAPEKFKSISCLTIMMNKFNHKQMFDRAKELKLSFVEKILAELDARRYYRDELHSYEFIEVMPSAGP